MVLMRMFKSCQKLIDISMMTFEISCFYWEVGLLACWFAFPSCFQLCFVACDAKWQLVMQTLIVNTTQSYPRDETITSQLSQKSLSNEFISLHMLLMYSGTCLVRGMNISFISHPFLYLVILNDNKNEIKNGSNRNKVSFISGISIDFQWVFCFVFGFPRENFKLCVRVLMLTCFFSFLIPIITKH